MLTPATIKSIQDIMRQDVGVDGDAQRLSQLTWLIYLKILDDEDKALEIRREDFTPTLPEKYQWRSWAAPMDGITGDKLIEFVNNELITGLKTLPKNDNPRTDLTRMAFQDIYNFMRKGTLLRQIINKVNEIDFNASKDRHVFNDVYERLLKSLQSAGNFGEMYTPRAVTQFVVEMVDPQIGESVLDPAVGTGGFLVHSLEHMRKRVKSIQDEQIIQSNIYGVEKKPLPFMLLLTNMMLHGVEEPITMRRGNTLEKPLTEYTDADKVDCVVTNPPFGGTEEPGIESNFPREFRTRETADLFLVLILRILKNNGRAGIVLPDSTLFGEGMKTALKKKLLDECNLHTIVRLPASVFAPYTGIATNLLFFTKGESTKEIWFYEHPLPEGQKAYSMTNPIRIEEFESEKIWWNNREENEHAWKVNIKEIEKRNFNLDIKNPRTPIEFLESPEELIVTYREKQLKVKEALQDICKVITEALAHHGTNDVKVIIENLEDFIEVQEGVEMLRKAVFMLAISGKLVPQDQKEGTSDILIKEAVKDSNNKVSDRRHRPKILPEITPEEIPFEIPNSWRWVRLGEITNYGETDKCKAKDIRDGEWVLELEDLEKDGGKILTTIRYPERQSLSDKNKFKKGDVLYGKLRPYLNKVIVATEDGVASSELLPIRWKNKGESEYLRIILLSDYFYSYVNRVTYGVKMPRLGTEDGRKALIPLPPIQEQKRIIEKVSKLMIMLDDLISKKNERDEIRKRLTRSAMFSLGKADSKTASK